MVIGDFFLPNAPGVVPVLRQCDLKTTGNLPKFYGPDLRERSQLRAPDIRAASVAAEYGALAHKADFRYSGAPQTQNDPIFALLCSFPTVTALAMGALGEWSREVGRFITGIGEEGSSNPGRFGCCHGMGQARGTSGHAFKCSGRASLRGVARVRHAALKAVTGTSARAHAGANANTHGAGNVWDAGTRGRAPTPNWT
jgi:hypothetical protein